MDKKIKEIIARVGEEHGIDEEAVKAALFITTNWTRNQMIELEYPSVLWPNLGAFSLMDTRCPEDKKEELKEYKDNFKK